ncbi:MAG: hypothetical protein WCF57_16080 [Pyrinomonadaceae bacterium]
MSKAQYALLFGFVGFYALLFSLLLVRACVGCFRVKRSALPKLEKVSSTLAMAHNRAWTRAVWRGKLALKEAHRMERAVAPTPRPHPAKAL